MLSERTALGAESRLLAWAAWWLVISSLVGVDTLSMSLGVADLWRLLRWAGLLLLTWQYDTLHLDTRGIKAHLGQLLAQPLQMLLLLLLPRYRSPGGGAHVSADPVKELRGGADLGDLGLGLHLVSGHRHWGGELGGVRGGAPQVARVRQLQ